MALDVQARQLQALVWTEKLRRFVADGDVLRTTSRCLYVLDWAELWKEIICECHNSLWVGHPEAARTQALIERTYYWPRMHDDVERYVKTFLVCQQDKGKQKKPAGLLEPLPIPDKPWESISMEFIVGLPKVEGYGNIIAVVDRFSKYVIFTPMPVSFNVEGAAKAFFRSVVKYWGLPRSIASNWDPVLLEGFGVNCSE